MYDENGRLPLTHEINSPFKKAFHSGLIPIYTYSVLISHIFKNSVLFLQLMKYIGVSDIFLHYEHFLGTIYLTNVLIGQIPDVLTILAHRPTVLKGLK